MINKRIFGSPIPVMVQKKLEARQKVAEGGKKPNDVIDSQYQDSRTEGGPKGDGRYSYQELISSNFNMQADLSSRTSWARMWTAIALVNEKEFDEPKNNGDTQPTTTATTTGAAQANSNLTPVAQILLQLGKPIELYRKIYTVGTNNLSTVSSIDAMASVTGDADQQGVFPPEHGVTNDHNKFLKPQAGIVSVSSETEGSLGLIKKTTVNFVVHNFADYDSIYNKYFMRPGAQIFLDFGWDALKDAEGLSLDLYDPKKYLESTDVGGIEAKLYGEQGEILPNGNEIKEDGFMTKCNGDCEIVIGIVTDYEAKILQNGSVECSLTLTSKNAALMVSPKFQAGNNATFSAKIEFDIDNLIFFQQSVELENNKVLQKTEKYLEAIKTSAAADGSIGVANEVDLENYINYLRFTSYGSDTYQVTPIASVSGLLVVGTDVDADDAYIAWGLLEDKIFNRYFGHGDNVTSINDDKEGNLPVKLDSSDGFTSYEAAFEKVQEDANDSNPPVFIVPNVWDRTYSFNAKKGKNQKSGNPLHKRVKEFIKKNDKDIKSLQDLKTKINAFQKNFIILANKNFDEQESNLWTGNDPPCTRFDKEQKRVPIREIYVKTKVVKDAFTNADNITFKSVINQILDAINKASYDLWEWKLVGNDNSLKINDMAYSEIAIGKIDERKKEFDDLFTFEVMSKNSIIKGYDVSLSIPPGEIGSMYAIQAMTGTPGKMYPISNLIQQQSVLDSILNNPKVQYKELKSIGFRYLPSLGAYNALNMESTEIDGAAKLQYYRGALASGIAGKSTNKTPYEYAVSGLTGTSHLSTETTVDSGEDNTQSSNTGNWDVNARVTNNNNASKHKIVSVDDYNRYNVRGSFAIEDHFRAIPLPMKLDLQLYGISSLKPGDIFKVDYLPQEYIDTVYFQVTKVLHSINSDGWYTSLQTQFRVSPHQNLDTNLINPNEETKEEQKKNLTTNINKIIDTQGIDPINETKEELVDKTLVHTGNGTTEDKKKAMTPKYNALDLRKEDGLLDIDIDDDRAYAGSDGASTFTTRYYKNQKEQGFHGWESGIGNQLTNNWDQNSVGYSNGSRWDYGVGTIKSSMLPAAKPIKMTKNGKTYDKCSVNQDFETLKAVIHDLDKLNATNPANRGDTSQNWFSRLFSFTIRHEQPVFIANPMYYWDNGWQHNGYGDWETMYNKNGGKYTYVGGVYYPGEKCYLIINSTADAARHWAVVPQVHGPKHPEAGNPINLSDYNWSSLSEYYSKNSGKWKNQGWQAGKMPEVY